MLEVDLIGIFISRLNQTSARYMLTGSVAAILYGEPRLTNDVDVVIELDAAHVEEIHRVFSNEEFSVPLEEFLRIESQRSSRGHCNIIHFESGLKADLYFMGRDPLHRWAMERRRAITVGAETVWIAPPEYVIIRKLMFFKEGGSEKHLRDIKLMLDCSASLISMEELLPRIEELGLRSEWNRASSFKV